MERTGHAGLQGTELPNERGKREGGHGSIAELTSGMEYLPI